MGSSPILHFSFLCLRQEHSISEPDRLYYMATSVVIAFSRTFMPSISFHLDRSTIRHQLPAQTCRPFPLIPSGVCTILLSVNQPRPITTCFLIHPRLLNRDVAYTASLFTESDNSPKIFIPSIPPATSGHSLLVHCILALDPMIASSLT